MDKTRDNEGRYADNADARKDDELSQDEMDKVAGGLRAIGPEARAGYAGPEDAAAGKGRRAGPEWDSEGARMDSEKSA